MVQRIGIVFLCFPLLLISGCGPSGPVEYPVSGTVKFAGELLPEGQIVFESVDGKTQPRGKEIINGRYSLNVPPGEKLVKILANKETGERDKTMNMPNRIQYIPRKYNSDSDLKREVTTDPSKNVFDFDLEEDKPGAKPPAK